MTVPNLIPADGTIINVRPSVKTSPYTANWWMNSVVDRIPETSVGWMVAQGWQVVDTYSEEDCGQTFYRMARQTMNTWLILQGLLNEYTQAYNEGRASNVIRYENIIELWNEVIHKTRERMDVAGDVSDGHITLYFSEFDTLVTDVENELELAKADATAAGAAMATQLAAYIADLEAFGSGYNTHKGVAEAFLVNLGTTELARINEHFDNLLSSLRQGMVNRGLYSSGLFAQAETRVERERNEAIAALNDKLNREKLENEHTLYGQKMQTELATLDGRLKVSSMEHQQGQFMVDTRTKCALTVMQARLSRAEARMGIRDREEKLMAYQLDTRNNLAIGLFGFMEKREDSYPNMESITKLVAGLGDSGGGWVQP